MSTSRLPMKQFLARASVLGVTALLAAVSFLVPSSAASAAVAPSKEACRDLGNGNLCIRVVPGNTNGQTKVTVWYDKNLGSGAYLRLLYDDPAQKHWDDGAFWIYQGQVRGYIWYNQSLLQGCFIAQLQDLTNGGAGLTNGGYVCY
jgi:hypothetical protein